METTFIAQSALDEEDLKEMEGVPQVRPWVRSFARGFDMALFAFCITLLCYLLDIKFRYDIYFAGFLLLFYLFWILIEPFFLTRWGATPGKYLLATKIVNAADPSFSLTHQQALTRSWLVTLRGQGLFIPFVSFVCNIVAYFKLKANKTTPWDEATGTTILHKKIGFAGWFFFFFLSTSLSFMTAIIKNGICEEPFAQQFLMEKAGFLPNIQNFSGMEGADILEESLF